MMHHQGQQQQQPSNAQQFTLPTEAVPWKWKSMPCVTQFTAIPKLDPARCAHAQWRQKRKSDLPIITAPKQFITEEKIAAQFNGMHISNNIFAGDNGCTNITDDSIGVGGNDNLDFEITARELSERLKNANRITVCEEIKKLQHQQYLHTPSLLPEALLNRIERPCTALVLWQPRQTFELHTNTIPIMSNNEQNCQNGQQQNNYIHDLLANALQNEDEIDDFADNNNTSRLDFNHFQIDGMEEDL